MTTPAPDFEFDAFISYSRADQDLARQVKVALTEAGLRVFLDEDDMGSSREAQLGAALRENLNKSRSIVVVAADAKNLQRPYVVGEFSTFVSFVADGPGEHGRKVASVLGGSLEHSDLPILLHGFQSFKATPSDLAALATLLAVTTEEQTPTPQQKNVQYRRKATGSVLAVGLSLLMAGVFGMYAPNEVRSKLPSPVLGMTVDRQVVLKIGQGKPGTLRAVTGIVVNALNKDVDGVKVVLVESGGSNDHVSRLTLPPSDPQSIDLALVTQGVPEPDLSRSRVRTYAPIYKSYVQAAVRRNAVIDWLQRGELPSADEGRPYSAAPRDRLTLAEATKEAARTHTITLSRVMHALSADTNGTLLGPKASKGSYQRALTLFDEISEGTQEEMTDFKFIYLTDKYPLTALQNHGYAQAALTGGSLCEPSAPRYFACSPTKGLSGAQECDPVELVGIDFSELKGKPLPHLEIQTVTKADCLKPDGLNIDLPLSHVVLAGRADLDLTPSQKWQLLEALSLARADIVDYLGKSEERVTIADKMSDSDALAEWLTEQHLQFEADPEIKALVDSGKPTPSPLTVQGALLILFALGTALFGLSRLVQASTEHTRDGAFQSLMGLRD